MAQRYQLRGFLRRHDAGDASGGEDVAFLVPALLNQHERSRLHAYTTFCDRLTCGDRLVANVHHLCFAFSIQMRQFSHPAISLLGVGIVYAGFNHCFRPVNVSGMLTLEQARDAILERIKPAAAIETVPLALARTRVVAAEIRAGVDNPAFDNSAMDGYALRAGDLASANFRLPISGEASAGTSPGILAAGTCMRIFTGAPLPAGADVVAMQEDVERDGDSATFRRATQAGAHIRRAGEDFRKDDILFRPGTQLNAFHLALLATAGIAQVPVYRRARVLVVATGDELVAPGDALAPGQIYESNRLATLAQVEQFGAEPVDGGMVPDDPARLRELLKASHDYDFVITSGGASVGDRDIVKQVFAEIGEIDFWKVSIKPGKPIAFGRIGERTHFFALPGNPVSSLVTYKLFVEPALAVWYHGKPDDRRLLATAANSFARQPGRTEFLRARLYTQDGQLKADVLKGQGSHMLGPIRETNALIRVELDSAGFGVGETVTVIPLFW